MKKRKKIVAIFIMIFTLFSFYFYYIKLVNPVIRSYTKAKINALTEQVLNVAVSNVINASINYDSVINIGYTNTGEIAYLNANQYVINTITREVVKNAQELMLDVGEDGVVVPLGTFTGLSIFNGRGPNVKLQMVPVGIVASNFNSVFTSVGINNTLHQLFLNIFAKVELVLPLKNCVVNIQQSVLLCEAIVVGKVPEVYFGNNNIGKCFDLTP